MGTMTDGVSSTASSAAILILLGSRSEYAGRETVICGACGRGQFNRGQTVCIACHASLLAILEPLCDDSDAAPREKVKPGLDLTRMGIRLRDVRRLIEMPQSLLALRARCSHSAISRYENCLIEPTIAFLDRVTGALRITMAEFLDDSLTVEQLAACSFCRLPGNGDLLAELIRCLPRLNPDSRALLIQAASGFSKSHLAPVRRGRRAA